MPDDRLIHGACGHSTKINLLSDFERLVWLGYKLAADDFGVMRYSAIPLQAKCRWLEQRRGQQVFSALKRVQDVGLIGTFTHQSDTYCFDPVWQTWQKILYPRQTIQPRPSDDRLDKNTQYLFQHHPKGAKLASWQHPDERAEKTGKTTGKVREDSQTTPGKLPELSSPVLVGSSSDRVRVGVGAPPAAEARSKRPVYTSDRFAVFEWQLDELSKTLGRHYEDFDLHTFFDLLSARSRTDGLVIPKADVWTWLQSQVLAEAKRRGLPMASAAPVRDRAAEEQAQNARVLAMIQEDRRAGR